MAVNLIPRAYRRRRRFGILPILVFFVLAAIISAMIYLAPGYGQVPVNDTGRIQLYFMGDISPGQGLYREDALYLPLTFFKEKIDPTIQWDDNYKTVIITTEKNVFHLPLGVKDGMMNLEPYAFTYPVIEEEGVIYLPINPLEEYYNLEIVEDKENSIVRVYDTNKPLQKGSVVVDSRLRIQPSLRAPWIRDVKEGEILSILREENGWYWVEGANDKMGFLAKGNVELTEIKVVEKEDKIYQPWNPLGQPVILTWEHAGLTTVNPLSLGKMADVNVLSATWFHLQEDGLVVNRADKRYVDWAHGEGKKVWGLFDNSFDPELTNTFLNDYQLRTKAIKQILSYVDLYELDGINIDFENMFLKDKEAFVQFVREITPLLHEKDRVVSVDVTFHSLSETWSMCYDRVELAKIVDYIIVMGYDEHSGGSKTAGSVSSLPWVERGLVKMLEEVAPDKLILGVPFYTRLWTEKRDGQGNIQVSSRALSMDRAEKWIKEKGAQIIMDEKAGQHYVEVQEGTSTYKIWLEDEFSMEQRIELMKKYRLAGLASWRRGFEKDSIWPVITKTANKR